MSQITTPAIMLRRIEYGDFDLIITFFSRSRGKVSVIAKSAKKSKKRFAGILEPFSVLEIVYDPEKAKGLPVLQEASLVLPFSSIRQDIAKTAYASYMAELIYEWTEESLQQEFIYLLFKDILVKLDDHSLSGEELSILFQMRFLAFSGFAPNLKSCVSCKASTDRMDHDILTVDLKNGGVVCNHCKSGAGRTMSLSKGTIKQLLWMTHPDMKMAERIRLTSTAVREGLAFLEAFVPFHLGKEPRSLKFLQQLRR